MISDFDNTINLDNEFIDPSKDEILQNIKEKNPQITRRYVIRRRKYALSMEQRDSLLENALNRNTIHYLIIRTQMETGMRVGEIANLIESDTNLTNEHPSITINERITTKYHSYWKPKTKSGQREIFISPDLAKMLYMMIKGKTKKTSDYIFISHKGSHFREKSIRDFTNKYAVQSKTIGRKIATHTLRRTFASFQLKSGKDIGSLSKDLGHKDIKTTMLYLFEIEDMEEKIKTAEISNKMHNVKNSKLIEQKLEEIRIKSLKQIKKNEKRKNKEK